MSKYVPYTQVRFEGTPEEINVQWVEARKSGIGGSDVAAIMGLNKYSSPLEIWLTKTGKQESPDLSGNQAVEWGNILEDVIAEKFKAEHADDYDVYRKNAMLVSKARPWAFANLDRVVIDRKTKKKGVLEIKTVGMYRASDWEDGVPAYYLTQVTHYLSITGYDFAIVAVLVGGQDYREYHIARDEADIKAVNEYVDTFWHDFVETDTPPALVGSSSEADALLSLHSVPDSTYESALDADIDLERLQEIKADIKRLEAEKTKIENNIKALIGDAKGIETESSRITWSRSFTSMFEKKRFLTDHPELAEAFEAYTTTKPRNGGLRISARKDI